MNKLIMLTLIIALSGCTHGFSGPMSQVPENAAPETKEGWQDGCTSGMNAYGNDFYKTIYPFRQNSKLISNRLYYTSWKDSYDYCRHWINQYQREGLLGQGLSPDLRDERAAKEGSGLMPPFLMW